MLRLLLALLCLEAAFGQWFGPGFGPGLGAFCPAVGPVFTGINTLGVSTPFLTNSVFLGLDAAEPTQRLDELFDIHELCAHDCINDPNPSVLLIMVGSHFPQ